MPRLTNPSLKGRHTRKTVNKTGRTNRQSTGAVAPCYHQFFVTICSITGTGYIERFMKRRPNCNFAEYYVIPNNDNTYDLFAYVQMHYPVRTLSADFPVMAKIVPTTVADKLDSEFHIVPDKVAYGVERAIRKPVKLVHNTPFEVLHTTVKLEVDDCKVVPVPCWLPQAPKIDCLLNRKKIYPSDFDE